MTFQPPPKCVDCKHHSRRPIQRVGEIQPVARDICDAVYDVVKGDQTYPDCYDVRSPDGWCGLEARMFKPKDQ